MKQQLTLIAMKLVNSLRRSRSTGLRKAIAFGLILALAFVSLPGRQAFLQQHPQASNSPAALIQRPFTTGTVICSAGLGRNCGTTKADYAGAYNLDLTCDNGFYDPIYGGTCWKCPDDTDTRGGWIRSATAVTSDDACWRVPKETTAGATKVKKTFWAWECESGSFWDGYDWGGCWTCPPDNPRRTLAAVWASNACASPLNETRPATLLAFNGCPKPDAATMGLKGKRLPGKPFLDIAGGWSQGVISGGCYACPVTDEEGNILITERNAAPIYGQNQGCNVLFKWKPYPLSEPGIGGLAGMKEFILESKLLDREKLTAGLYFMAGSRGMKVDSPQARDWVAKQWQEIANGPYRSEAFRSMVYQNLILAAALSPQQRTPAQTKLITSFEDYINRRRTYIAQMALDMYDAWKAHDEAAKQSVKRSSLQLAFDYGTVPLDFHNTLSAVTALGAEGVGAAGALVASLVYQHQLQTFAGTISQTGKAVQEVVDPVAIAAKAMTKIPINPDTSYVSLVSAKEFSALFNKGAAKPLSIALKPLNLFKGTAAASAGLAGATVITVAFVVIQSIAIDQFIAIQTARPKLEAALAQAKQPVNLSNILNDKNGSDLALYYWAKALDRPWVQSSSSLLLSGQQQEDQQLLSLAALANQQASAAGYRLPGVN